MPKYYKAYYLRQLASFPDWSKQAKSTPDSSADGGGAENAEDPIVYLHEDFTVSRNALDATDFIFDTVTPEWEAFCKNELDFQVPDWEAESVQVRNKLSSD